MKKVALFATILALALSASAQESHYPGPTAVGPNARNGANPNGVTTTQAANARSVSETARQAPIAAVGSHAVQVGSITDKLGGICLPIMIWGGPSVGLGCK
jgi:hypothetical protein